MVVRSPTPAPLRPLRSRCRTVRSRQRPTGDVASSPACSSSSCSSSSLLTASRLVGEAAAPVDRSRPIAEVSVLGPARRHGVVDPPSHWPGATTSDPMVDAIVAANGGADLSVGDRLLLERPLGTSRRAWPPAWPHRALGPASTAGRTGRSAPLRELGDLPGEVGEVVEALVDAGKAAAPPPGRPGATAPAPRSRSSREGTSVPNNRTSSSTSVARRFDRHRSPPGARWRRR